jgi:biopolymer transport protein TolQ
LSVLSAWPLLLLLQESVAPRTSNLVDLLLRSSPIAKFVLLLLLVFSLASWAIIISKELTTRKAQQQNQAFLQVFGQSQRLSDLRASAASFTDSPLTVLCTVAEEELRRQSTLRLDAVQRALQSTAIDETTKLERSLGWLASTASAAPFIGLFGTVIGIIIAFEGLSTSTTTSIQAVAPGIAEALITTAAGIAAAVPAVLAYNHYLNRIKVFAAEMDSFSLRLLNLIEREAADSAIRNPQSAIRN